MPERCLLGRPLKMIRYINELCLPPKPTTWLGGLRPDEKMSKPDRGSRVYLAGALGHRRLAGQFTTKNQRRNRRTARAAIVFRPAADLFEAFRHIEFPRAIVVLADLEEDRPAAG